MKDNMQNPYVEGRALTDNELTIDWARLKTENDMLRIKLRMAELERDRSHKAHWLTIIALVITGMNLIWVLMR